MFRLLTFHPNKEVSMVRFARMIILLALLFTLGSPAVSGATGSAAVPRLVVFELFASPT